MQANLEGNDVKYFAFGVPIMVALIVLGSVAMGAWLSNASHVPTEVRVAAASPSVNVNTPAPRVENNISAAVPNVSVNVPTQAAPVVNVTTAQPLVKFYDQGGVEKPEKFEPKAQEKPLAPAVVPVSAPDKQHSSSSPARIMSPIAPPKDEEATLDALYKNAEIYISAFCTKNGLQEDATGKKWEREWKDKVGDASEQVYINSWVVDHQNYFDMDKAKPEQVVEACRILLRYRDQNFAMLAALNKALMDSDNIRKTVAFLKAGPK